jgi:nucleoside-diphosphate-sugar epimerase
LVYSQVVLKTQELPHGFEELCERTGGSDEDFYCRGTGAIGRPLIAELLARGHSLVALTRSPKKAQALVHQGIEPAIADVFDPDAVKAIS